MEIKLVTTNAEDCVMCKPFCPTDFKVCIFMRKQQEEVYLGLCTTWNYIRKLDNKIVILFDLLLTVF
jgi:hypothetical protein